MRPMENRQDFAAASEIGDLRVGTGEVRLQMQPIAFVIDQERHMARHEPRGTMTDEQAKIIPLDVLQQYVRARVGEGGRQINHVSVSVTGLGGVSSCVQLAERRAALLRTAKELSPKPG